MLPRGSIRRERVAAETYRPAGMVMTSPGWASVMARAMLPPGRPTAAAAGGTGAVDAHSAAIAAMPADRRLNRLGLHG